MKIWCDFHHKLFYVDIIIKNVVELLQYNVIDDKLIKLLFFFFVIFEYFTESYIISDFS